MKRLNQIYTDCMNCKNTKLQCPNTIKDKKIGYPPRGFYFEHQNIDILVVGKNPGHILENEQEHLLYNNKDGNELFKAWMSFRKKYYISLKNNKSRSSTFHKNLYDYLERFTGKKNDVFNYVAETNLVKCSTLGESDNLMPKTINECYSKYLLNEIKLYNPKVILALGREVENYLNKRKKLNDFNIPVVYIKHPSYHYKKEDKEKILLDLTKTIKSFIKK
jgi:uracil-DNA glycosylase